MMDEHARRIGREVAMCDETIPVPIDPNNIKEIGDYNPTCETCQDLLTGWKKLLSAKVTFSPSEETSE
jgi:hypothetical protein